MAARRRITPSLSPQTRVVLRTFADLLKAARLERRMPQAELAQRLGQSRYTVMALERGEPTVAMGTWLEAAVILGVPLLAPTPRELAAGANHTRHLLHLLPERARPPKVDDNDF